MRLRRRRQWRGSRGVQRGERALLLAGQFFAPRLGRDIVIENERVDRIPEQQSQRGLVAGANLDMAGERAVKVALRLLDLEFEQALRRLRSARMLVLKLGQRVMAGLQLVLRATDLAAGLVGLANFFLGLAAGLLRLLQSFAPIAQEILRVSQLARMLDHGGLSFIASLGERGLLRLQRLNAHLEIPLLQFETGQFLLLPLAQPLLLDFLRFDFGALGFDIADASGEHLQRFLLLIEALLCFAAQLRKIIDLRVEVRQLLLADADFLLRAGDFLPRLIAQAGEFVHPGAVRRGALLSPFEGVADGRLLLAQAHQFRLDDGEIAARRRNFFFLRRDAGIEFLLLFARAIDFDLQRRDGGGKSVELMPREFRFQPGQFLEAGLITARLARLTLERADLPLHFADDVGEADEIGLGVLELAQCFLLLALVLGDACGFLENGAAVLGTRREDRVDLALLHDRVGGAADAGIHEHGVDVAQAARRFVELVLARAVAENATRDGDFVVGRAEVLLAIAEGQRDLGHAGRRTRFGAGKDDVLHFAAAQGLGRLLAEHPADAVEDVALAAAVGADDGGDSGMKFERGAVRKRLESDDVERLQIHGAFVRPRPYP